MSTTIKPTVGRVVWFYPSTRTGSSDFSPPAAGQPLAAIVAAVLASSGVDIVNLSVFDAAGELHPETMVPLFQEGQDLPEDGFYATWMPYQIGQAKKDEDREQEKQMAIAADRAADDRRMRAGILDMALRTPGLANHSQVLAAAAAYQAHIEGEKTAPAPLERTAPGQFFPGYAALQPHQQRVVDEERELDERLRKLHDFIGTPTYNGLPQDEQEWLADQYVAMSTYARILAQRIEAFTPAAA